MKNRGNRLKDRLGSLCTVMLILVSLWTVPPQKTYAQSPISRVNAMQHAGQKVTLDPGHGWNHDSGASANGMLEKDITLDIANRVKPLLEAQGIQVSMTRTGDEPNYGLDEAVKRANQFQPDLVVAIHVNAGGGTGTESCYQMVGSCSDPNSDACKNRPANDNSKKLGELLTNSEVNKFGFKKRGDFPEHTAGRCDRYATTKWTQLYIHNMTSPAAVIETAFIDGPADVDVKLLRENRADFAQAIADAIFSYLGTTTVPPSQPASSATMLVVDVSGSMGDPWQGGIKIDSAKAAANQIVNMLEQESQASGANHRVGIATFTTDATLNIGLTGDYTQARTVISGLYSQNSTNVGAGLSVANTELRNATPGEAKFIILLSDGMSNEGLSNDQILAGPVQDAANAGTCIYTVGFGDQGDIDENLLRQIAAGSGCGQYYYATDVNQLEQIYIRIRHQAIGNMLGEFTGTIAQGQTVQAGNVVVPPSQDQLAVTLLWPGSKLSLVVIDPNGNAVNPNDPNVNIKEYANLIYMIVMWPIPGTWQLAVTGVDIPEGSTIYDAIASSRTGVLPTLPPTVTLTPPVVTPIPSKPKSEPDSGFSILVVILIAALGGMGVYVYTIRLRQKRPGQVSVRPGNLASASLLISNGSRMGQVIPLGVQPLAIGRGPVNDLQLSEDASISRQHAIIRYAEGRWFIQDQGSQSGTFVNNMPVTAVILNPNDQIRIGSIIIVFRA
jgi:N-acetylmuramoyl-L-alanine amidase/Mg-chelatase subunit ChlD